MIRQKRDILNSFVAYDEGMFNKDMKLKVSVAYKVYNNISVIENAYQEVSKNIDDLRDSYGWNRDLPDGGLDREKYKQYSSDYEKLLEEEIAIAITAIPIEDFDGVVSFNDMKVLFIMIDDG